MERLISGCPPFAALGFVFALLLTASCRNIAGYATGPDSRVDRPSVASDLGEDLPSSNDGNVDTADPCRGVLQDVDLVELLRAGRALSRYRYRPGSCSALELHVEGASHSGTPTLYQEGERQPWLLWHRAEAGQAATLRFVFPRPVARASLVFDYLSYSAAKFWDERLSFASSSGALTPELSSAVCTYVEADEIRATSNACGGEVTLRVEGKELSVTLRNQGVGDGVGVTLEGLSFVPL